jgi:membrane protease YdiL (CAAX protease family)
METTYTVPWTVGDTWLGLLLMVVLIAGIIVLSIFLPRQGPARSVTLVALEPLLVLPVAIVLGRKRISWKHLGFRRFPWDGMALGCGALLLIYPLVVLHNFLLVQLGVQTQGDSIAELYETLGAPVPILLAGVVLAPLAEEIFFRGFLFPGLRQRYGWIKAMLLSSAIFAAFHLQPVALIPTFILGCVLAYAYQRSNSIWPGIILHLLTNGLALCVTAVAVQFGWH